MAEIIHSDLKATLDEHPALQKETATMAKEIVDIAAASWDATKDKADPKFVDCIPSHRDKLVTHAQAVADKGLPIEGASDFEVKVDELLKAEAAKGAKAKAAEKGK